MLDDFTIMLPVHRGNIPFANECLTHLLNNSNLNIVCVDDFGNDDDYIKSNRISFLHNTFPDRQPLVKIWNQCIKICPTDNIIIASWRQRPTPTHFNLIFDKINEGYGMVAFDGLHFFSFNKYLTTQIGFFDEGFTHGQFEDTDWFNRLKTNDIAIFIGDIGEVRHSNGRQINSLWLNGAEENKKYYISKWVEDTENRRLIQNKNEMNLSDREFFKGVKQINYKPWSESILAPNLVGYFNTFPDYVKNF